MLYIFESELPESKSVNCSLRYIYGIGKFQSKLICKKAGLSLNYKTKNLKPKQKTLLIKIIKNLSLPISSDLKKIIALNNLRLTSIKSYKGLRKKNGLPIRGQRTHTNAKTARKKFI